MGCGARECLAAGRRRNGQAGLTLAGLFSTGLLTRFPGRADDTSYSISLTPQGQGVSVFSSFNPISAGEVAVWFRNTSGANVAIEFCFTVY